MFTGLDLLVIKAITALIADPFKLLATLLPVSIVVEKFLDSKIKGSANK